MSGDATKYEPQARAEEKRASRESDERALASGAKTDEQLRRENGLFGFPNVLVDLDGAGSLY